MEKIIIFTGNEPCHQYVRVALAYTEGIGVLRSNSEGKSITMDRMIDKAEGEKIDIENRIQSLPLYDCSQFLHVLTSIGVRRPHEL